ncbi:MAG: hypothetical protein K6B72_12885, partial [Lachnospiraceae bacterium]|nr:hypothetical protein [Lachnospiraceae bacterium]
RYGKKDHILIRMTDSFPFFKEKYILENGVERIETNYHIADGMFSRYTNYELPNGACSAETSGTPMFETVYLEPENRCPVLITNVGTESFEISLSRVQMPDGYQPVAATGMIHPDEVFGIYPPHEAMDTLKQFEEAVMKEFTAKRENRITQDEINRLLGG